MLAAQLGDDGVRAAHNALVDSWGDLTALPDDYAWRHVAYHLRAAGREADLRTLLLNPAYLQAKLRATDVRALLADFDGLTDDQALRLVHSAIRMSAHQLTDAPEALPQLLYVRLHAHAALPEVAALRAQLHPQLALVPLQEPTHEQAGGALVRVLAGHTGAVTHVALSADGKTCVSSSEDGSLQVWDVATGAVLPVSRPNADQVIHLASSANGVLCVSASEDGSLRVWDVATGAVQHVLKGHTRPVKHVALSADGSLCVSASDDKTLRVWDVATGAVQHVLKGHTSWVRHVALSADGALCVSASEDGLLRVWDVATGAVQHVLKGHTSWVRHVALSADGALCVSASDDKTLRVWDVVSGAPPRELKGHEEVVSGVLFMSDDRLLSWSQDQTLKIWNLPIMREEVTWPGQASPITCAACVGEFVVSGNTDKKVYVWDASKRPVPSTTKDAHERGVTALALDPKRTLGVTASRDKSLRIWNLANGQVRGALMGHGAEVKHVSVTHDGARAVSSGRDRTLRVWDLTSLEQINCVNFEGAGQQNNDLNHFVLMPDERTVIAAHVDGSLREWHLLDGKPGRIFTYVRQKSRPVRRVDEMSLEALQPSPMELVAHSVIAMEDGDDDTTRVKSRRPRRRVGDVGHDPYHIHEVLLDYIQDEIQRTPIGLDNKTDTANFVLLSSDGQMLISGHGDYKVRVWSVATGELLQTIPKPHNRPVVYVTLSADGQLCVSTDEEGTMLVWNLKEGRCDEFKDDPGGRAQLLSRFPRLTHLRWLEQNNDGWIMDIADVKLALKRGSETAEVLKDADITVARWGGADGRTIVVGDVAGRVLFLRLADHLG